MDDQLNLKHDLAKLGGVLPLIRERYPIETLGIFRAFAYPLISCYAKSAAKDHR